MGVRKGTAKFTINELVMLNKELNNLMAEKTVGFIEKYEVAKLLAEVQEIIVSFEKDRLEVFKKYGKKDGENYSLEGSKDKNKAIKELNVLGEKEKSLTTKAKLTDFKELKESDKIYFFIYRFFGL